MSVEDFLRQQGVAYEKHQHPTTYTAQGLAHAEHVSGYMVAKPVVVKGSRGFVMCVLPAPQHLDLKRLAEVLGDSQLRLATEAEMSDLFPDCELGAQPPIGALYSMQTVADQRLAQAEYLVMQAGKHTEAVRLRRADWEKLCQPLLAAIAAH